MSSLALLDACILVPQRLSSLLLTMAEHGLYEPRWSEPILTETERALVQVAQTSTCGESPGQTNIEAFSCQRSDAKAAAGTR